MPRTDRRSLYHTEAGIAYGIRQHNVLLGNGCRGTVGDFLVCGGFGNDIKWILHPRNLHSDFHFQSHFMFNESLGETGISFELWNGVARIKINIDGQNSKFVVEKNGTSTVYGSNDQIWNGRVSKELSLIRIVRKNEILGCYINDFKVFGGVQFSNIIDSVGWTPNNNTILVSSLSLIKPFKASYRISFDVGSAINAGTTELLEISLMHGLFEVSERYHGINGETLLPNNAYSFNFDVDMYYENEGWGVIDTVKLRVGTDDFGFSALTLSVKLENNGYKQLLHLQHADVVIAEGKWYQNFEPYCIFEGGSGALFSHLQVTRPEQYEKLELKTNYSVSIWVKVKSQNAPLQNQNSCKVFNPPASRRSSNSVGSTCSSSVLDGSSSDSWRSSWLQVTT